MDSTLTFFFGEIAVGLSLVDARLFWVAFVGELAKLGDPPATYYNKGREMF